MRHGKKVNHLGRTTAHREALLSNMASSLILSKNKRIRTTLAKAKELRTYIEPLITRSKEDSTNSRRVVFSYLQNKEAVTELFREIATKIAQRPGGYLRILKTGFRKGDNAEMCMVELVDYNENLLKEKLEKKAKTTRRGRGGAKKETVEGEIKTKAPKAKTSKTVEAENNVSEPSAENDILKETEEK
ncbi:MAG TPA: 50S ribosomal protein L17 [Bacteroidales bacterium]|nr:50S ribosomal protein L17 [Bacteroidales bacterium]